MGKSQVRGEVSLSTPKAAPESSFLPTSHLPDCVCAGSWGPPQACQWVLRFLTPIPALCTCCSLCPPHPSPAPPQHHYVSPRAWLPRVLVEPHDETVSPQLWAWPRPRTHTVFAPMSCAGSMSTLDCKSHRSVTMSGLLTLCSKYLTPGSELLLLSVC